LTKSSSERCPSRAEHRFPRIDEFAEALVESVERSRGMQLETKQAIVDATPNLVAAIGVALVAPELVGLANPNLPVIGTLTLNWPIMLILALIESALLLGIRWHLVGILSRLFSATHRRARPRHTHVRAARHRRRRALRVQRWRNSIVGSAEGIVGIAYVFGLYQIIGPPLIQTIALAVDYRLEPSSRPSSPRCATARGVHVLAIWRTSGSVLGTSALALCWAFFAGVPIADRSAGAVSRCSGRPNWSSACSLSPPCGVCAKTCRTRCARWFSRSWIARSGASRQPPPRRPSLTSGARSSGPPMRSSTSCSS